MSILDRALGDREGRALVERILERKEARQRRFTREELEHEWIRSAVCAGLHCLHKYGHEVEVLERMSRTPGIHEHPEALMIAPTRDQTWCEVGEHDNCSGYTEDESDPESCYCSCHDGDPV